jgi:hypothetical protein
MCVRAHTQRNYLYLECEFLLFERFIVAFDFKEQGACKDEGLLLQIFSQI